MAHAVCALQESLDKHMKIFLIVFLVFVFVLSAVILAFQPPKPPKSVSSLSELETHLTELTHSNVPPGLSVIVVKNDEVVYANSFGVTNGQTQAPASMDNLSLVVDDQSPDCNRHHAVAGTRCIKH